MSNWRNKWAGATAVCLASGPSLTAADIATVREWRGNGANRYVLVCNTTFRSALWADVLVAYDSRWWDAYHKEVTATFAGVGVSWMPVRTLPNVTRFERRKLNPQRNSGVGAVVFSAYAGCARVLLLGYDASPDAGGRLHHHEDHPAKFTNCVSIATWPGRFRKGAELAQSLGTSVVNCSRNTVLDCFPRQSLEQVLC